MDYRYIKVRGRFKSIRIKGRIAFVELSREQWAKIDVADIPLIESYSWNAVPSLSGFYATSSGAGYMHRLITNCPKDKEVDHINHDTLDNRRKNLRIGSHKANMRNGKFALATHCPHGHAYDEANTYFDKHGRRCKRCNAEAAARRLEKETKKERVARLKRSNERYYENYERYRAKQNQYAAAHREEKRDYDRRRAAAKVK